jgi:hypothetical protein
MHLAHTHTNARPRYAAPTHAHAYAWGAGRTCPSTDSATPPALRHGRVAATSLFTNHTNWPCMARRERENRHLRAATQAQAAAGRAAARTSSRWTMVLNSALALACSKRATNTRVHAQDTCMPAAGSATRARPTRRTHHVNILLLPARLPALILRLGPLYKRVVQERLEDGTDLDTVKRRVS